MFRLCGPEFECMSGNLPRWSLSRNQPLPGLCRLQARYLLYAPKLQFVLDLPSRYLFQSKCLDGLCLVPSREVCQRKWECSMYRVSNRNRQSCGRCSQLSKLSSWEIFLCPIINHLRSLYCGDILRFHWVVSLPRLLPRKLLFFPRGHHVYPLFPRHFLPSGGCHKLRPMHWWHFLRG